METTLRDMKEALASNTKPDTTHVRYAFKVYTTRPGEYGSVKYQRANYLRPTGSTKGDFIRLREYLRAAQDHIDLTLDSMEKHQEHDPDLLDEAGMKTAAYAVDDTPTDSPVGPSYLPHVAHACTSLMMAVTQATMYGLLPEDPGQPWTGITCRAGYTYQDEEGTTVIVPAMSYRGTQPIGNPVAISGCPGREGYECTGHMVSKEEAISLGYEVEDGVAISVGYECEVEDGIVTPVPGTYTAMPVPPKKVSELSEKFKESLASTVKGLNKVPPTNVYRQEVQEFAKGIEKVPPEMRAMSTVPDGKPEEDINLCPHHVAAGRVCSKCLGGYAMRTINPG